MNVNRSALRFLITSGTYLFLILLAATVQPVWGHKAATEPVELRNVFFLPLWCGIALIAILYRKIKKKNEGKELISSGTLFWTLIISVVVGFLLNRGEYNAVVLVLKCISNGISVALLSLGYLFSHKKAGRVLLIIEFIFWTLKALLYYNTSPDLIVSGYFSIACWVLRAVFITKFLKPEKHTRAKLSSDL